MTTRVYLECDMCHVEERRPRVAPPEGRTGRAYGTPDGWTEHGEAPGLPITNADMHHCADCQPKCVLC